jgi:hypothetical protein
MIITEDNKMIIDKIMAYENGELKNNEVIEFFAELVKTGMAFQLQGHYGRTATNLIKSGYIDNEGNVLQSLDENGFNEE